MNYDKIVSYLNQGEKIYNLPLRVTFYARVSTDSDIQLNSLNNQLEYYKNYINNIKKWNYVEGYIDEGITGTRADKRPGFQRMIRDARMGLFDLIITKEVSRFARDLEDSIHYIRILKENGVGIFFENQNLNTFDLNSELILNIMFNLAQDESRKLSSRIKFGHKQAIKKGHVLGSSNITGYKKDKCKLMIVPEEAKLVRKIFELYSSGNYGFYKLGCELAKIGYSNKNGNIFDKDSLKRIITNPKYKGYYRAHTYEIMDYRTKRRKKIKPDDQVLYKCSDDIIPAIVSEELWDKANDILIKRNNKYYSNNHWSGSIKYPLSSKIYCKEHMCCFSRSYNSKNKKSVIWACSRYLKYRVIACESPLILEEDLYIILRNIMNKCLNNKLEIADKIINLYKTIDINNSYDKDIKAIEKKIKIVEDKKQLAFDLVFNGQLERDSLKEQFIILDKELNNLCNSKEELINQKEIICNNVSNIEKLNKHIMNELKEGILEDFIRVFVSKIIVEKINNNRNNIKLEIFLNLFDSDIKKLFIKDICYLSISKRLNSNKFVYCVYIS